MKTLLPSSVPNFISQDTIFQAALLRQKRSSDGGFFVWLKLVRNLEDERLTQKVGEEEGFRHTNRRTTDDFPTAASPLSKANERDD